MILKKNGIIVNGYESWYQGKTVVVAIDSSKTNSGMVVGDTYGNVLDDYELNGSNDKDVLALCYEERKQLKYLFEGAKIQLVGIEDIITKNGKERQNPMDIHMSRFKITSVFMSFICFFQDNFGITPELVNNQKWKSEVLPEEYRKRTHKKGSLDYHKDLGDKLANRTDDITDAYSIYEFLCKEHGFKNIRLIEEPCPANKKYTAGLFPMTTTIPFGTKLFKYNNQLSLKQNCDTMTYHCSAKDVYCVAEVDINSLTIEEIYEYAKSTKFPQYNEKVQVFCKIEQE